jgi:hypothetical protein
LIGPSVLIRHLDIGLLLDSIQILMDKIKQIIK